MFSGDTPAWVVLDLAVGAVPSHTWAAVAVIVALLALAAVGVWWQFLWKPRHASQAPRPMCASCDGRYLDDPEFRAVGDVTGVVSRG